MYKQLISKLVLAAVAICGLAAASLSAETLGAKITVSHPFVAGDKVYPAGNYTLVTNANNTLITIRNQQDHSVDVVTCKPSGGYTRVTKGEISFQRYGDQYFLHRVAFVGAAAEIELLPWAMERKAKAEFGQAEKAAVAELNR
jgi:hypothetical protein